MILIIMGNINSERICTDEEFVDGNLKGIIQ